ncbi:Disease resistance protein RUN1 [Linum perenne]
MALNPSTDASPLPPYTGTWEHDCFVCFRGDVRRSFICHLMGYLEQHGVRVFIDEKLKKTEDIDELLTILKRSAMSVVVFSEKFADSIWCLEEVALIADLVLQKEHRVLPVFYSSTPDDVTNVSKDETRRYSYIIDANHELEKEDRDRYIEVLKRVANKAGSLTNKFNDDRLLCMEIVKSVLKRLTEMSSSTVSSNFVGMNTRITKVRELLAANDDKPNVIGLWGGGGFGKSVLAKALYHELTPPEDRTSHHFVSNVNSNVKLEEAVRELYSTLLSENNLSLRDLDVDHRTERLSRLKVVVVLDNVETLEQLEKLLLGESPEPTKIFGSGSVIIITSRNLAVLNHVKAEVHRVEALDSSESLELFSLHAFKQRGPVDDFKDLSFRVASYCKGNPLALKVLGGALFGKSLKYWWSYISGLDTMQKPEIHDVLGTSYYALTNEEKKLFMDLACFIHGTSKTKLIKYLATTYKPSAERLVENLIDKSLIVCVPKKSLEMIEVHDLLKEVAWNIVGKEPYPSRIKNPDYIRKHFAIPEANTSSRFWQNMMDVNFQRRQAIESISLDLSLAKEIHMEADAFECMDSVRLLEVDSLVGTSKIQLPDVGLNTLPNELRWFKWIGFPSRSLPSTFCPENLVVLVLRHSKIECCWMEDHQLELLRLKGCESLVEIPEHVQDLNNLIEVDLRECSNLKKLPPKLNSKCLKYVRLSKCPNVTRCPDINSSSRDLELLDFEETPLKELPSAIHRVKHGGNLRLCGKWITSFPQISRSLNLFRLCHTTVSEMGMEHHHQQARFDQLELVGNTQLKSLPENIWDMVGKVIWVEDNPLIESFPDISKPGHDIQGIYAVNCEKLKSVPSGINNLKSLRVIHYIGAAIESLTSSEILLEKLRILNLHFCKRLECIPENINQHLNLFQLSLTGCAKIESLPELPPNVEVVIVSGCKSLQALPSNIKELNWSLLYFENCPELKCELQNQIKSGFCNRAKMSPRAKTSVLYSGSELPEWCINNDRSVSYDLELPLQMLKGIVFGVVFFSDAVSVELRLKCKVAMGAIVVATFSSRAFRVNCGSGARSDYVFLWSDKNVLGETQKGTEEEDEDNEEEEAIGAPWFVKYAGQTVSFRIYTLLEVKNIELKKLGVSLLY